MLTQLHVRNLAVIDEVELEFSHGFTVLTGETGAGKSILFDALDLCLGGRGDSGALRAGTDRAEITAGFELAAAPAVRAWLAEHDLDSGDDCLLRRVINADGRSRGYVNGHAVPLRVLAELGSRLVDICGQQDHQSLRSRSAQRAILDSHGALGPLLEKTATSHADWNAAAGELASLGAEGEARAAQLELLGHQLEELTALAPQPGESSRLEAERNLVSHAAQLIEGLDSAIRVLYEQDEVAALDSISAARRTLEELRRHDPELDGPLASLAEAGIQVEEAVNSLRSRLQQLEHDPERQTQLEERLAALRDLARKHRVEPDQLDQVQVQLAERVDRLENSGVESEVLERRVAQLRSALVEAAAELTRGRTRAARALEKAVASNLAALGMGGASFRVAITPRPDGSIGATGADQVEFLVSANPGQPEGPVARVASGGELSRLNLAIQVSLSGPRGIPVLLFDEVDAGVGGAVAEIVGQKLRALSAAAQVLCVTHLPQVASQATAHFRVSKHVSRGSTRTQVDRLLGEQRVEEIARMLGGVRITRQTRAHAQEMLSDPGKSS
ncbi:MAG: DNA repair protein RecN [Chromatiales bacterium]|nr:DNA repair protein RecN [Chromatiales bacterium]